MLINRQAIKEINSTIEKLAKRKFNIQTQYKFIKIKKAIQNEEQIYQEQLKLNCESFFEKDNNGQPIINKDGAFKIKAECLNECYLLMSQMNSFQVQLPDIYFSLDELEGLNLPLEDLSILEPFIK